MTEHHPHNPENTRDEGDSPASIEGRILGMQTSQNPDEGESPIEQSDQQVGGEGEQFARHPHGRVTAESPIEGETIDQSDQSDPEKPHRHLKLRAGTRKKRGPGVANSPHREEYVRLMQAGWTSFALERYAMYRYGESIAATTFRGYKAQRVKRDPEFMANEVKVKGKSGKKIAPENEEIEIDVMGVRNELIALQLQRVAIDVKTEMDLGKLFSSTGKEISLASDLMDKLKQDQFDFGVLKKAAEEADVTVRAADLPATTAPAHNTLGEALGLGAAPNNLADIAKALGTLVPITRTREA